MKRKDTGWLSIRAKYEPYARKARAKFAAGIKSRRSKQGKINASGYRQSVRSGERDP
jgi:hypothetical protein